MVDLTVSILPEGRPRYLMGVGSPADLLNHVARGVDIFDCVLPTRLARNGAVFIRRGCLNLHNARFAGDPRPIEEGCGCYTCRHFSRAYLRHLINSGEILGLRLTTLWGASWRNANTSLHDADLHPHYRRSNGFLASLPILPARRE